jgi:hypothetical protein
MYTSFHLLKDDQLWYHRLELNGRSPTWNRFVQLVNRRFRPPLTETSIGELALLHRDDFINDYCNKFMALSSRDPSITQEQHIQLFVVGLGKPLCTNVALLKLATLDEAIMFIRAYEQHDATSAAPAPTSTWPPGRPPHHLPPASSGSATSASLINGKPMVIRRLSVISERRKNGQCCHCDSMFTQGRKQVCKQLFIVKAIYDK